MTRERFVELVEAVAMNSDLATHCYGKRGSFATEEEEEANLAKAHKYYDRRNDQMGQLNAFFDTVQAERAALVAVVEAATALLADASTVVGRLDDVVIGADYVRDLSESLDTYAATVATSGRAHDGEGGER